MPPSLVNDMGRQYAIEQLKMDLSKGLSEENPYTGHDATARYVSEFVMKFFEQPLPRQGYRNFLEPGSLVTPGEPELFDPVVADVVKALRAQGRDAVREVARDREIGWQAALKRASLTPEPPMIEPEPDDPYARFGIPRRVAEFSALQTPDWILWLMQQLAPEFAHASEPSLRKGLLFLHPIDERLAWAVAIDKGGRGNMFRFGPSPTLSLAWLKDPTRRRPPVVMYRDALANDNRLGATWPREIETQLACHLQRFRRLIAFYRPFVDSALRLA